MPDLRVIIQGKTHRFPFSRGQPVRDILDTTEFRVRSACHGIGACGLCRIRIVEGDAGPVTTSESYHLSPAERDSGVRLACQVRPGADVSVELVNPAPESVWRSIPFSPARERTRPEAADLRPLVPALERPLGVAVDVGTTNLSLALLDLRNDDWLAERWGPNPQADYGADVISRLIAANDSPEAADELNRLVVKAIHDGLWDIATRECFELQHVVRVTLVGNTAMLALLAGKGYQRLLQPAHWSEPLDCSPPDTSGWIRTWGVHPKATIEVVPPLAGFVGSDLLAGLVATRLVEGAQPALLVDFGTNSEIALWSGNTLWVTAAAGGPAFESSGISHGIPAETGAVYRVGYDPDRDRFDYGVIGDGPAKGICGSGLVDLVAALRRSGRLTAKGRLLAEGKPVERFPFSAGGSALAITNRDVDALQRAKAAIATGILELCRRAGVAPHALRRVCIAGAFGHFLDIANARDIGLLPNVVPERVELVGNTALTGCGELLRYAPAAEQLHHLRSLASVVNLAHSPDFDETFLTGLFLQPLQSRDDG